MSMNKKESKIPSEPDHRGQTSARAISEAPLCQQTPAEQLPDCESGYLCEMSPQRRTTKIPAGKWRSRVFSLTHRFTEGRSTASDMNYGRSGEEPEHPSSPSQKIRCSHACSVAVNTKGSETWSPFGHCWVWTASFYPCPLPYSMVLPLYLPFTNFSSLPLLRALTSLSNELCASWLVLFRSWAIQGRKYLLLHGSAAPSAL